MKIKISESTTEYKTEYKGMHFKALRLVLHVFPGRNPPRLVGV